MTGSWLIVFHIMTLESLVNFGSYQWHGIIFFGRIWSNAGGILKICHEDRILNSWSVFLGSVSLLIFFFFLIALWLFYYLIKVCEFQFFPLLQFYATWIWLKCGVISEILLVIITLKDPLQRHLPKDCLLPM